MTLDTAGAQGFYLRGRTSSIHVLSGKEGSWLATSHTSDCSLSDFLTSNRVI